MNAATQIVLTIIGSGFGAGIVTFGLNFWKEDRDLKRSKTEALYLSVHRYTQAMTVLSARILTDQGVDDAFIEFATHKEDFNQLYMIISLYFPELRLAFDRFKLAVDEATVKEQEFNTNDPELSTKLYRVMEEGERFKQDIVDHSRLRSLFYLERWLRLMKLIATSAAG